MLLHRVLLTCLYVVGAIGLMPELAAQEPSKCQGCEQAEKYKDNKVSLGVVVAQAMDANGKEIPGAVVTSISPSGPARKAGLQVDDVVVKVGELSVKTFFDVAAGLSGLSPGQSVPLTVLRRGEPVVLVAQF